MSLNPDTRVWTAIDRLAVHDSDHAPMSLPEMQILFAQTTIDGLRSKLASLQVIQCEGQHDDPCSAVERNTCPLREWNLACGHQDLIRTLKPTSRNWQTPLSAILTACHVLYADGCRDVPDRLHAEARAIADQLYIADGAAYLSYHRLREGRVFTREDLVGFPGQAWTHPLAAAQSIDELKQGIREREVEYGTRLAEIRDELLALIDAHMGVSADADSATVDA